MRIFQVTDTHVGLGSNNTAKRHFAALMAHTEQARPDLLVITGDLPAVDGDRAIYEWMRSVLPASVPVLILPGNHDDKVTLFDVFEGPLNRNPDFAEHMPLADIDLLFLDTAEFCMPASQRASLADVRPGSVLFTHFPTRRLSAGYMDTHWPLGDRDLVDAALRASPVAHVFCGHFHASVETDAGGYQLSVTPSPAFDVALDNPEFELGEPGCPYREIVIDGTDVRSTVHQLEVPAG